MQTFYQYGELGAIGHKIEHFFITNIFAAVSKTNYTVFIVIDYFSNNVLLPLERQCVN